MAWPWVSRSELERVLRDAHEERARLDRAHAADREALRHDLAAERVRYDALLERFVGLRRQGFEPPPTAGVSQPPDLLPPVVAEALMEAPSRAVAEHLRGYAVAALARGTEPADVAKAIRRGADLDGPDDLEADHDDEEGV